MASNDVELNQALNNLFTSKHGADVTFIVHGREVKAHKIIIATRSPVLKEMIEEPTAPADQRHEIVDPEITATDFENFLKFLYTDRFFIDLEEDDIMQVNFKSFFHLANVFEVPYLYEKCAEILLSENQEDNVCSDALKYAEMALPYGPPSTPVLQRCMEVIHASNENEQLNYRDADFVIKWISPELVMEIVKQCPRTAEEFFTENKIFKKVFEWSKNYCIQQNQEVNAENIRALMLPIMPHFHPGRFTLWSLITIVRDFNLLSQQRWNQCIAEAQDYITENPDLFENRRRNFGHHERNDFRNLAMRELDEYEDYGAALNHGRYVQFYQRQAEYGRDNQMPSIGRGRGGNRFGRGGGGARGEHRGHGRRGFGI